MTPLIEDGVLAGIIGSVLPLAIAIILQQNWTDGAKAVVAFLLCVAAAVVTSFFSNEIRIDEPGWDWGLWFGAMYGSAMTTYARVWKPTTVAPKLEEATSLTKGNPS